LDDANYYITNNPVFTGGNPFGDRCGNISFGCVRIFR
jgi:hypothetical protein